MSMSRYFFKEYVLFLVSLAVIFPLQAFSNCDGEDNRPICNQCDFKRMPEADWAMRSSPGVIVDDSNIRFISFKPRIVSKNTGLAIFHGGNVDWSAYSPMAHWIAEEGYRAYLIRLGDEGTACAGPPAPQFHPYIDDFLDQNQNLTQWVFAGHSLGGVLASNYMKAKAETRTEVKGISYWGSYANDDLSDETAFDFLSGDNILASKDGVANWPDYIASAVNLPSPTQTECIQGGNHAQFGWYGPQSPDDESEVEISREAQQEQIKQRLLIYLDRVENNRPFLADDNTKETEDCQDIFIPPERRTQK